jgi:hypothetical protein
MEEELKLTQAAIKDFRHNPNFTKVVLTKLGDNEDN